MSDLPLCSLKAVEVPDTVDRSWERHRAVLRLGTVLLKFRRYSEECLEPKPYNDGGI